MFGNFLLKTKKIQSLVHCILNHCCSVAMLLSLLIYYLQFCIACCLLFIVRYFLLNFFFVASSRAEINRKIARHSHISR